jgi:hypothetical protein
VGIAAVGYTRVDAAELTPRAPTVSVTHGETAGGTDLGTFVRLNADPDGPPAYGTITRSVSNAAAFRHAVENASPNTTIKVAPGAYSESMHFTDVRGAEGAPVVITALDPDDPPVFLSLQLSDIAYVELSHLTFRGSPTNGLNIDDGGSYDTPSHHVVLRRLTVTDVGPDGNRDGIKLSGLDDFRVHDCHLERWGSGGSGIDMVGCHRGLVDGNVFRYQDDKGSNAVQMKGGTSHVTVRGNLFDHPGARAVNVGGSTGFPYFRPSVDVENPARVNAEARDIVVEGNRFIGSGAPIAFVGVDGAIVRYNTIYRPGRWALRILQETRHDTFVPSRGGVFTDNLIVFRSDEWASGGVNIGPDTDPSSFTFARNWWYCIDDPSASHPTLPATETDGVYGVDPALLDRAAGDLRLAEGSPASRVGATALPVSP